MIITCLVASSSGASASVTASTTQQTSAWPDATNTGVPSGTVLTNAGAVATSAAGQIISAKNITGSVNINHNNCILEKSKIKNGGFFVVSIKSGVTGTIVRDCEIDGSSVTGCCGINGSGTFLRNNIHHAENGINLDGSNTSITSNYIHDFFAGGSPHYDGIQIDGGASNVTITGNRIDLNQGQVCTVMVDNYFGAVNGVLVDSNWLSGGVYTVYCDAHFNSSPITNVKFTNNKMGKGVGGYTNFNGTNPVWTGNKDAVTGNPV